MKFKRRLELLQKRSSNRKLKQRSTSSPPLSDTKSLAAASSSFVCKEYKIVINANPNDFNRLETCGASFQHLNDFCQHLLGEHKHNLQFYNYLNSLDPSRSSLSSLNPYQLLNPQMILPNRLFPNLDYQANFLPNNFINKS